MTTYEDHKKTNHEFEEASDFDFEEFSITKEYQDFINNALHKILAAVLSHVVWEYMSNSFVFECHETAQSELDFIDRVREREVVCFTVPRKYASLSGLARLAMALGLSTLAVDHFHASTGLLVDYLMTRKGTPGSMAMLDIRLGLKAAGADEMDLAFIQRLETVMKVRTRDSVEYLGDVARHLDVKCLIRLCEAWQAHHLWHF